MNVSKAKRLKEMASENGKLKKLLAGAHLDVRALKVCVARGNSPPGKREATAAMVMAHPTSGCQA